jgi:hypothetical protein
MTPTGRTARSGCDTFQTVPRHRLLRRRPEPWNQSFPAHAQPHLGTAPGPRCAPADAVSRVRLTRQGTDHHAAVGDCLPPSVRCEPGRHLWPYRARPSRAAVPAARPARHLRHARPWSSRLRGNFDIRHEHRNSSPRLHPGESADEPAHQLTELCRHRSSSTLAPAATTRSFCVITNQDHPTVTAPRPAPTHGRSRSTT